MEIIYYGHSCFMIESDVNVLTDPYIKDNPKANKIDIAEIKPDYVLLTHGHRDHVSDAMEIAQNYEAKMIGSVEVIGWFKEKGQNHSHALNFGGSLKVSDQTIVKYVQAAHSSSMPDGSYGGQPGSFIIDSGDKTIFLAGDTSLHMDLELFGRLHQFDLVILPIGGNFTMGYEDAAIAAEMLNCSNVLGCHFDTFPIIEINHKEAQKHFSERGLQLQLLEVGSMLEI